MASTTIDGDDDAATESISSISNPPSLPAPAVQILDLPPLKILWDDDHVERNEVADLNGRTRRGWKCLWCNRQFFPDHHTRAVKHLIKQEGCDIRTCQAKIPNY